MMTAAELIAAATLRERSVEMDGKTVTVREPDAFIYTEYQSKLKAGDKAGAIAHLIQSCVLNADGAPLLTEAEALQIAKGSTRVAAVLAVEITRLIYDAGGEEKKA